MTTVPKVSIILPTYNRAWCLMETVESVLNQTYRNFELIIVDDGSTDDTLELLAPYQQDKRIRCFFESHCGRSIARNKGLEKARGDYIAFLDSDDIWFPDKLERQLAFLDSHPEIGAVHGPIEMMDLEGHPLDRETTQLQKLFKKVEKETGDYTSLSESAIFFLSTVLIHRKCLEQTGHFDPNFASREDLDLCLRITLEGYRMAYLQGCPLTRYRYRGKGFHGDPVDLQSQLQAYHKHLQIIESRGLPKNLSKAYKNFLLLISECHYYLEEYGQCRKFLIRAIKIDPKVIARRSSIRNLIVSHIPRGGIAFLRRLRVGRNGRTGLKAYEIRQTVTRPTVILSHAGVQYSYPLALALQETELLKRFFTTFYYAGDPKRLPPLVQRYVARRHYDGLRNELIFSNPWPEVCQKALAFLLRKNYFATSHVVSWCNSVFDLHTSCLLKAAEFSVFIGLSGSSLESIKAAKSRGKITVIDQHDIHFNLARRLLKEERKLHPEFASSMPYWPPLEKYLDRVKQELELADFVFVPSSFALRSHLAEGISPHQLILIPHGVKAWSEEITPAPLMGEKFRILFVGTLTQRKGIKYLLEAVKRLNLPKVELIMIGDQMVDSEALIPYRDYFRHIPYTPHPQLGAYFKNAHLLVLPSVYDAFGMVALDAMWAGLPVIVSENTAAGSDVVRDGVDGYVVPIRNIEAIQNKIETLYADRPLLKEIGRNAHERVKEFSWDQYKNRLKKTIEEIYCSNVTL